MFHLVRVQNVPLWLQAHGYEPPAAFKFTPPSQPHTSTAKIDTLNQSRASVNARTSTSPDNLSADDEKREIGFALAALRKLGHLDLTAEDIMQFPLRDEYEEELKVMADVRAYFQVSYQVSVNLKCNGVVQLHD